MVQTIHNPGWPALIVSVKFAQRFVCPLARLRERVGVRKTGMASFIIRVGTIAMPVWLIHPSKAEYKVMLREVLA